jgi:hypothetical protein
MIKKKRFRWKADSCSPRRGANLVRGNIYDEDDYLEKVVSTWIENGFAERVRVEAEIEPEPEKIKVKAGAKRKE